MREWAKKHGFCKEFRKTAGSVFWEASGGLLKCSGDFSNLLYFLRTRQSDLVEVPQYLWVSEEETEYKLPNGDTEKVTIKRTNMPDEICISGPCVVNEDSDSICNETTRFAKVNSLITSSAEHDVVMNLEACRNFQKRINLQMSNEGEDILSDLL